jgi:hypothetical protein
VRLTENLKAGFYYTTLDRKTREQGMGLNVTGKATACLSKVLKILGSCRHCKCCCRYIHSNASYNVLMCDRERNRTGTENVEPPFPRERDLDQSAVWFLPCKPSNWVNIGTSVP